MTNNPKIRLSRLRDIGWKHWDPIGLGYANGAYDEGCADEYDSYLLHVASLIRHGGSMDQATAYLVKIASEHMGLTDVSAAAAAATSQAIADYLSTLSDSPTTDGTSA